MGDVGDSGDDGADDGGDDDDGGGDDGDDTMTLEETAQKSASACSQGAT